MSSICGIVDTVNGGAHFERLKNMSRTLILRGRDGGTAYINGGVSLHSNHKNADGEAESLFTLDTAQGTLTIVFDGRLYDKRPLAKSLCIAHTKSSAELALRAYEKHGARALSLFDGEFALAIYNERLKELLLARDRRGAKPLYYAISCSELIFASEIKALLSVSSDCLEVESAALKDLILSDTDAPSSADLYRNVNELPSGCFAIYSRIGMRLSSFPPPTEKRKTADAPTLCPDAPCRYDLAHLLNVSLFAFDRPAFDTFTPSYISLLSGRSGRIIIEDQDLSVSPELAYERADRLGAFFDLDITPTLPKQKKELSPELLFELEKKLTDNADKLFSSKCMVRYLFGDTLISKIKRKGSQQDRIRALGLLLESETWLCRYPIIAL